MRLSASQIGSFERCPTQYKFEKIDGRKGLGLSATVFGTVVHHALHAFERQMAELVNTLGTPVHDAIVKAEETALGTFDYYWHPSHVEECAGQKVDIWIRGDSYGTLRQRGFDTVRKYVELWLLDDHHLLSLEHPFEVPLDGTLDEKTGEPHTISGFVDRLVVRHKKRVTILDTDDWKTGKVPTYLRHHLGLTVYCYASTKLEFWLPFENSGIDPEEMMARYAEAPRHANWYDLKAFKLTDAGYRGPADYRRLAYAADQMAKSIQASIFPLRISGATCQWCPHASYCPDGEGIPDDDHGGPGK